MWLWSPLLINTWNLWWQYRLRLFVEKLVHDLLVKIIGTFVFLKHLTAFLDAAQLLLVELSLLTDRRMRWHNSCCRYIWSKSAITLSLFVLYFIWVLVSSFVFTDVHIHGSISKTLLIILSNFNRFRINNWLEFMIWCTVYFFVGLSQLRFVIFVFFGETVHKISPRNICARMHTFVYIPALHVNFRSKPNFLLLLLGNSIYILILLAVVVRLFVV